MPNPSIAAELKTVLASLDAVLLPGLRANLDKAAPESVSAEKLNLSTALTIGHLLRHVLVRIEQEDALLCAERDRLVSLHDRLRTYMSAHRDAEADLWLGEAAVASNASPADEVTRLRISLHSALAWLQQRRAALNTHVEYQRLREEIRQCIAFQVQCESQLIDAAMAGRGCRR